MLQKFIYDSQFKYTSGWDKFALQYSTLLQADSLYMLTKELSHELVTHYLGDKTDLNVLDLNCGTGNDFPYFLTKAKQIVGTDGSKGMLNKASETYREEISSGKILLHEVLMQKLNTDSFPAESFDVIYSITGGYTYINDETFKSVNQTLSQYLRAGGFLIHAHLTPFCLGETLYYLRRGKFRKAFARWKRTLQVSIKEERYTMFLRSAHSLKRLRTNGLNFVSEHPILTTSPPYQTGCSIDAVEYQRLKKREQKRLFNSFWCNFADQVLIVEQKPK